MRLPFATCTPFGKGSPLADDHFTLTPGGREAGRGNANLNGLFTRTLPRSIVLDAPAAGVPGPGLMVRNRYSVSLPTLFPALRVTLSDAVTSGAPEIMAPDNDNPAGRC